MVCAKQVAAAERNEAGEIRTTPRRNEPFFLLERCLSSIATMTYDPTHSVDNIALAVSSLQLHQPPHAAARSVSFDAAG